MTFVSGLANVAGDALDASSGPHSRVSGCWLNGMRTPTMPLPMENNPRVVFERLFGEGGNPSPVGVR